VTNLRLGILPWSQAVGWSDLLDVGRRVERLGYEHLWAWDHLYASFGDPAQPIFEGWQTLAAWAMTTERVRVGLMVGANTFRNPGLVAKTATTLDHLSGGRAILGLGGAWFELEHMAYGIPFGRGFGDRLDWLDESAAACRALLDGDTVTSAPGAHYAFRDLHQEPRPVQQRLPLMIGGSGRTKTLRTVARYADMWNAQGTPVDLAASDGILREHCRAVGRDEREIERTGNLWMVIRDSEAEARAVWAAAMAHNRKSLAESLQPSRPLLGPPAAIAQRMREMAAVGFESVVVEVPAPYDIETLERLIGEVKPLVDAA
jgi:alkanesulfonate monooxygenase SsuD/methylene tetrahydromethanopterin reductase-like flavin-dependent oxidoreductase (luciferase family)